MGAIISGGCLCGGVRYEVRGAFLRAGNCHCSRCRKHSGAAALTQGRVRREDFRLVAGAELVRVFVPEGGASKAFCGRCGSSLFGGSWPDGEAVALRLCTIDGDAGLRPQFHTGTESKAAWDVICAGLPQHAGPLPPSVRSR